MLEDLIQTIETLQKRIREHKDRIENYESRTRVTLIDPMLCVLGWDVSDPNMVEIEPKVTNGWADYALLSSNRRTAVFVEAKKLADKDSPVAQVVSYVVTENIQNNTNVRYCISTNGDAWVVYDITAQKSVMQCSIAKDDAAKCALQFLGLWRRSLSDGVFDSPVEPVIDVTLLQEEEAPPPPPDPDGWIPLNGNFQSTGQPAPTAISFPDGQIIYADTWRSVLIKTASWLFESSLLTSDNCQIGPGMGSLFSLDGKRPDGTSFHGPIRLAHSGIILEVGLSASAIVGRTRRLLKHFEQDPSKVFLQLPGHG